MAMPLNGTRRLRLGMVGGGPGAFIGAVHRIAARLDDHFELVAGAFSSDPAKSKEIGATLQLEPARIYDNFSAMARIESTRTDRIDAVAIVTPNHLHHAAALTFLEAGIHVFCEKPMATSAADAKDIVALTKRTGTLLGLAHTYSGYPMVRQAKAMVAAGELGTIRLVHVEYLQDWLATAIEKTGNRQAEWRTDPERSGGAGCLGDIATHAFHLAEFVTGLRCQEIGAELTHFVTGRRVDDDVRILTRFDGGARGIIWSSQVTPGHANGLRLRIYGESGALEWFQEEPEKLRHSPLGAPSRVLLRGTTSDAGFLTRVPAGHPEGYLEAFGQLYSDFAALIWSKLTQNPPPDTAYLLPTAEDGLRGVRFIEAALASSRANCCWTKINPD